MTLRTIKKHISRALTERDSVKRIVYGAINTRPFDALYRLWYNRAVRRRLADFTLRKLMVTIEGFNGCNARCVMCPYKIMTRPKEVMSMELFEKVVNDCVGHGITEYNLNFYNEPLLDPLVFERVRYLKNKNLHVKFFSNGSVMDEKRMDGIFASGIDIINFSVDGASREVYEKIRVGLQYDRMLHNINWILEERKKRGVTHPQINLVYTRQNLNWDEVDQFRQMWAGKVDNIYFSLDDNRNETAPLNVMLAVKRAPVAYPCLKLWSEIVVMSNGKVALCCIDYDGKVIIGDFNTQTLEGIWNSSVYRNIRKLHLQYQADKIQLCKSCLHPWRLNVHSWW